MVSITYGHKLLDDCDDASSWGSTNNSANPLTGVALTCLYGDVLKIGGTPDAAADEYVYYEIDVTDFSTTTYPSFILRYYTSESANGLGARIKAIYTSGSEWLLGGTAPAFKTTWTTVTGTLTTGKTLDKIQFWADDYPDSLASGAYYVYYDFLLIHKDTFTLPNTAGGMDLDPAPRYLPIPIPSRITDITQNLGSESTIINVNGCDLDQGTWKRTGDTEDGQVFLDIAHNSVTEPWQWLTIGNFNLKVTTHPRFRWRNNGDGSVSHLLDLVFREYSLGDKSSETEKERFGL